MQVIKSFTELLLSIFFFNDFLPLLNTKLQLVCKQTHSMLSLDQCLYYKIHHSGIIYLVNAFFENNQRIATVKIYALIAVNY